jgi:AcrR family transcriptional regulator
VAANKDAPSRSEYSSPLRARQAAQTRASVLAAAARLFIERGWAATTIGAIAANAGTAVETVYASFGSKSGLLTAAIDAALVGDDEPVPLADRAIYAKFAVGSRRERLSAATALITSIHERSVPLLRALQEAAASDCDCAVRWDQYERDRRTEVARGAALVLGRRPSARVIDVIWALASPEVYAKLVIDCGWSTATYRQWLATAMDATIRSRAR